MRGAGSIARPAIVGRMLDISPVPLAQVYAGKDGRQYEVSGQAGDIVRQLQELDPSLRVVFNEGGMFFAVQQIVGADGAATPTESDTTQRKCVGRFAADDWGPRVVKDFEMRAYEVRNGISAAPRLDAGMDAWQAQRDHEFDELVKERAYPLFRSFQRNLLGENPRVYLNGTRRRRKAAA